MRLEEVTAHREAEEAATREKAEAKRLEGKRLEEEWALAAELAEAQAAAEEATAAEVAEEVERARTRVGALGASLEAAAASPNDAGGDSRPLGSAGRGQGAGELRRGQVRGGARVRGGVAAKEAEARAARAAEAERVRLADAQAAARRNRADAAGEEARRLARAVGASGTRRRSRAGGEQRRAEAAARRRSRDGGRGAQEHQRVVPVTVVGGEAEARAWPSARWMSGAGDERRARRDRVDASFHHAEPSDADRDRDRRYPRSIACPARAPPASPRLARARAPRVSGAAVVPFASGSSLGRGPRRPRAPPPARPENVGTNDGSTAPATAST